MLLPLFLLLIYASVAVLPLLAITEPVCSSAGYPDTYISFTLQRYCVREVNETEYLVPLEDVKDGQQPPSEYFEERAK